MALFDYWRFFGEFGMHPFEMHKVRYRDRRASRPSCPPPLLFLSLFNLYYGQNAIALRGFPKLLETIYIHIYIEINFKGRCSITFSVANTNILCLCGVFRNCFICSKVYCTVFAFCINLAGGLFHRVSPECCYFSTTILIFKPAN